eukprot:6198274-Pleurochrysis_carterae.AAC.3
MPPSTCPRSSPFARKTEPLFSRQNFSFAGASEFHGRQEAGGHHLGGGVVGHLAAGPPAHTASLIMPATCRCLLTTPVASRCMDRRARCLSGKPPNILLDDEIPNQLLLNLAGDEPAQTEFLIGPA